MSSRIEEAHKQVLENAQKVDPGFAEYLRKLRNPDQEPDFTAKSNGCNICRKKDPLVWKSDPEERRDGRYIYYWYCPDCYSVEKEDAGFYDYSGDEDSCCCDDYEFDSDPDDNYKEMMKEHILGKVDYRDVENQWFFDDQRYGDQEMYESCKEELRRAGYSV